MGDPSSVAPVSASPSVPVSAPTSEERMASLAQAREKLRAEYESLSDAKLAKKLRHLARTVGRSGGFLPENAHHITECLRMAVAIANARKKPRSPHV